MKIMDKVDKVKDKLNDLIKKYNYKKANKERKREADLTLDMVKCAGDLGAYKKEYEWIIRDQSRIILQGMQEGHDVYVQKNQLLDAAVGYMLVKEALYVLESVASYDGIVRAYELLDVATKRITGEKTFPFSGHSKKKPERTEYEFLNSAKTVQEKKEMAGEFIDELIRTGNIDKCIEETRKKRAAEQSFVISSPHLMPDAETDISGNGIRLSEDELKMLQEMRKTSRTGAESPHDGNFAQTTGINDNNDEGE